MKSILSYLRIPFAFLTALLLTFAAASVCAQNVHRLRTYHDSTHSRVVIELDEKPDYSEAQTQSGATYVVRVRNVKNKNQAPSTVNVSKDSCIVSVKKALDGNDVRYVFSLKGCSFKNSFVLNPSMNSKAFRLVIDFDHKQNASANKKESPQTKSAKSSNSDSGIDLSKSLAEYEKELYLKHSTPAADGFRTMTAQSAALYKKELSTLREEYKKAKENQNTRKDNKIAKKETKPKVEIEEVVSDTDAPPAPVAVAPVTRPFIIAIDAGHGGKDPGAIGKRGVREKNVTLAISKYLVNYINSDKRFRGVLIRSGDYFVDLNRRSEVARQKKADLLISVHADSVASGSSTARGASVLVLSERRANYELNKSLEKNQQKKMLGGVKEATTNGYCDTEACQKMVTSMAQDVSLKEGELLAKEILSSISAFTRVRKNSPIDRSLAVIKAPDIPSLLIETGYLSNTTEEIKLNQINYQKQLAYRIYLGIRSYYDKYPAKNMASRLDSERRNTATANSGKKIKVAKGDTLSKIAAKYGTSVKALKDRNALKSDVVFLGQTLYLP